MIMLCTWSDGIFSKVKIPKLAVAVLDKCVVHVRTKLMYLYSHIYN